MKKTFKMKKKKKKTKKKNNTKIITNMNRSGRVNIITRTSSLADLSGASIARQVYDNTVTSKHMKKKVNKTLSLKGIPGTVRSQDRPGMEELLRLSVEVMRHA